MGWVGNIFLVIGIWLVGYKNRKAFIFSVLGESIWLAYSIKREMYDLAFICVIFGGLAIRNWYLWGKKE